jgi:DNA polymerase sigma
MVAFERVQFLLSFYYVNIELFGSCANGIAIQNSDIDIAVKPEILNYFSHVPEHLRLQAALENLQQIFSTQPYISDIKVIGTASVPIIKLKIDTSVPCLDPSYGEIFSQLNRPHRSGAIETDIIIETLNLQSNSSHLGISSTQLIKQWLQ